MKRYKKSLHALIRIYLQAAILIPVMLLAVYLYLSQTSDYKREMETIDKGLSMLIDNRIDAFVNYHESILALFASESAIVDSMTSPRDGVEILEAISRYDKRYSSSGSMALGLEDGRMYSKNSMFLPKDYDPRERPWYSNIKMTGESFVISEPYRDAADPRKMTVTFSYRISDKSSNMIGVAGLDVDLANLIDSVEATGRTGDFKTLILSSQGAVLEATDGSKINPELFEEISGNTSVDKSETGAKRFIQDGYEVYSRKNEVTGWYIVILRDMANALQVRRQMVAVSILLILIMYLASTLYSKKVDRQLIKPLDLIVGRMEDVDLDAVIENTGASEPDLNNRDDCNSDLIETIEVTKLKGAFNRMIIRIQEQSMMLIEKKTEISRQYMEIEALYEETIAMNDTLNVMVDDLNESWKQTVYVLSNAIEANDEYTRGHCDRVKNYALEIGERMGLDREDLRNLEFAALLHDVGKVGVPNHILNKEGYLTKGEMEFVHRHPAIGYNIIRDVKFLEPVAEIILSHHENPDGSGYPYGKKLGQITLPASILRVADAFDAMTTARSYRKIPLSREKALQELSAYSGKQFDEVVVNVALTCFEECIIDTGKRL